MPGVSALESTWPVWGWFEKQQIWVMWPIYLPVYWLTDWLNGWSRDLLMKQTGSQLVKKFSVFYGTRKFITGFTNACLYSKPVHALSHFLKNHFNIIFLCAPTSSKWSLSSGVPYQTPLRTSLFCTCHVSRPSNSSSTCLTYCLFSICSPNKSKRLWRGCRNLILIIISHFILYSSSSFILTLRLVDVYTTVSILHCGTFRLNTI